MLRDAIGGDYRPTVIALLFMSLWDMGSLPPREAPRYGWWQASETQSHRLWQGYTKNLDWEISRGFDPDHNIVVRILNSDPKSSRASYIASAYFLSFHLLIYKSLCLWRNITALGTQRLRNASGQVATDS